MYVSFPVFFSPRLSVCGICGFVLGSLLVPRIKLDPKLENLTPETVGLIL